MALSKWELLYDATQGDVIPETTSLTALLNEHLYATLYDALQGNAGEVMKTYENPYLYRGVKLLYAMKPIFMPKWPSSAHDGKMIEFYKYLGLPSMFLIVTSVYLGRRVFFGSLLISKW